MEPRAEYDAFIFPVTVNGNLSKPHHYKQRPPMSNKLGWAKLFKDLGSLAAIACQQQAT